MPASELCAFEILRFRPDVGSKRLVEGPEPEASKCLPRDIQAIIGKNACVMKN